MEIIDNLNKTLRDDLATEIKAGGRVRIAAACFSIYAFQALKEELQKIEHLDFIFTSPTFTTENESKQKREFYIPRLNRERTLYGSDFEVKLRNELTQKAIAKECADWIREKVTFKSNITNNAINGFIYTNEFAYLPVTSFTAPDLGAENNGGNINLVTKIEAPASQQFLELFKNIWNNRSMLQDVTDVVLDNITAAYNENAPEFIYFVTLYNIFNEFLDDISEDVLPNEQTGYKESCIWKKLYNFQKEAAIGIINKLETYNGCILADSVGLGKTFTALSVIKYYECKNKSVLVLCPKKLAENWNTYRSNYKNNPIAADRLRYDVLFHTDLNRPSGQSNGIDLSKINWGNYDLVVIDESHNFRNGGQYYGDDEDRKENRYLKLLNQVIRAGVKTKVLMLSATPVNNRFIDLKNQLALAYEGTPELIDSKLNTSHSIDDIFRQAQRVFNAWSKNPPAERTTEELLKNLDFDFFRVLDSVTIARSRKHIQKYYDTKDIGTFPDRLKPISMSPCLTDLPAAITYSDIYNRLIKLTLAIYTPTAFIQPSKIDKYNELFGGKLKTGISQSGREMGIRRLMAINLMKRLESSVYSFKLTLDRIRELIKRTNKTIEEFEKKKVPVQLDLTDLTAVTEDDIEDENTELSSLGMKTRVNLADMDYISWRREILKDLADLNFLSFKIGDITPSHDSKLQELLEIIKEKIEHPLNGENKKVLIFTAFSDTAEYLYQNVSGYVKKNFGLNTAMITGSVSGKSTVVGIKNDFNTVLTCFSPISKDKELLLPDIKAEIDVLIGTDCISEGQNLQDCDYLINYDIHWNPVRIIQRFGRIDRIGSTNAKIQLVNFWPDVSLDEYINLKLKVETRMKIVNLAATGDDNIISEEDKQELEYRKAQLKRLREEVVDIEDMTTGISIMDLGLNEFRLDLLEYVREHGEIDQAPFGLHAVVAATEEVPPGVIFVLKNRTESINIDKKNHLHPFYLVYVGNDGEIVCDYLSPKKLLDKMRFICRNKDTADEALCQAFNRETANGKRMKKISDLLGEAISSVIQTKEESDLDSFLSGDGVTFKNADIKGLDDFELICFVVVREKA